jgi:hypothetical protein
VLAGRSLAKRFVAVTDQKKHAGQSLPIDACTISASVCRSLNEEMEQMDNERFDRLARQFAKGVDRRGILKGLIGGAAAVAAGGVMRRPALAQCNLGACTTDTDCTCAGVETCGNDGECCRTTIGIYCNPHETGSHCCSPNYICVTPSTYPPLDGEGCQCNTAEGFVLQGGVCCIPDKSAGNANHPDLCCSGCVCDDGNCCDASHCQPQCQAAGDTCNSNHPCCHPGVLECTSTTTAEGVCCILDGKAGDSRHPDFCCSGCVCDDGNCCDAQHCKQTCVPVDQPCNVSNPCCHPEAFTCSSTTGAFGTCKRHSGETCDQTTHTLCQAAGFRTKCCPGLNRPCNKHKNGTFDCGVKDKTKKDGGKGKRKSHHKQKR